MPKIYLSPSNQAGNPCKYGDSECDHCNLFCDELVKYLDACGIQYKRAGKNESLASRVNASNKYKPDVHYCIHTNAGGGKRSELYGYNIKDAKWLSLANAVKKHRAEIYSNNIKLKQNRTFYEITATTAKCLYDEVLFHDNSGEAAFFHSNVKALARAAAKGLCDYFGIAFNECGQGENTPDFQQTSDCSARLAAANEIIARIKALAVEQ